MAAARYFTVPARCALAGLLLAGAASAQSVNALNGLGFGSFLSGSGGNVGVSPAGMRSASGGVILIGQGAPASAARLAVTGTANASYAITLPVDGSVTLADGSGHTMLITGFSSSPAASGTLSAGGTQLLSIGATLVVGAAQARGSYSGAFAVTVNYP